LAVDSAVASRPTGARAARRDEDGRDRKIDGLRHRADLRPRI